MTLFALNHYYSLLPKQLQTCYCSKIKIYRLVKTDSIFYKLFKTFPTIFFELMGQDPTEAEAYELRSVEIKQTAFRIDGVFIPVSNLPLQPIQFVEVQF
jgi:hypothetical protein